jgi:hypothetical protein
MEQAGKEQNQGGDVMGFLPDVTDLRLADLITTTDPVIKAAAKRLTEEAMQPQPPEVTFWSWPN